MKMTAFVPSALACAVALAFASIVATPQAADAREVKGQARGNVNASANRSKSTASHGANRSSASREVNRTSVNRDVSRTNVNVNRNTRVDVDRNIDIDVDVDHDWDHDWDHPVATAAAVGGGGGRDVGRRRLDRPLAAPELPDRCRERHQLQPMWRCLVSAAVRRHDSPVRRREPPTVTQTA